MIKLIKSYFNLSQTCLVIYIGFILMNNVIKKLEEQITFLQQEISQMSSELFSQQKEITCLKKEISNFNKKIDELNNGIEASINKDDEKPPHY